MPVEIAPGDGEFIRRIGTEPVGVSPAGLATLLTSGDLAAQAVLDGWFVSSLALDPSMASVVADPTSATRTALDTQYATFGAAPPTSSGEFVWFKTDGAGTLIDIVTGVN